jgi:hypothetical protein
MTFDRRDAGKRSLTQPGGDAVPGVPGKRTLTQQLVQYKSGTSTDPLEVEADNAAAAVVSGRPALVNASVALSLAAPSVLVDDATPRAGQLDKAAFLAALEPALRATAVAELGELGKDCPYITRYLTIYAPKSAKDIESFVRRYTASRATTADGLISDTVAKATVGVRHWVQTRQPPPELAAADPAAASAAAQTAGTPPPNALDGPQRKADSQAPVATSGPAGVLSRLGDGTPLDSTTGSRMAAVFGTNFSDVRVHADEVGATMARDEGAHAFTLGSHVAFAPGRYQPGTVEGDALLAHELAHVVQQRGATQPAAQKKREGTGDGDGAEHDADRAAASAVAQLHGNGVAEKVEPKWSSDFQLQRCPITSLNEGESDMLPFASRGATFKGDPFSLSFYKRALDKQKPSAGQRIDIFVDYAGHDDADNLRANFQLAVVGNKPLKPTITTDKASDWTKLTIDAFGDGKWLGTLKHTVDLDRAWSPASRSHTFAAEGPSDKAEPGVGGTYGQRVLVRSADALPIDETQSKGDPQHKQTPVLTGDAGRASAKMTLDEMLTDPKFKLDATKMPWSMLKKNLDAASGKPGDPEESIRLTRIQETLSKVRPVFLALGTASKPEAYLEDISAMAIGYVGEVRAKYEAALGNVWSINVDLSAADTAFTALWHRLTGLYLQKGKGVDAMLKGGQALAQDIVNMTGSGEKNFDRIRVQIGVGKGGTNALHTGDQVDIVRREFESGKSGSLAKVAQVVDDAQVITGLGTLIASDQLFHKFKTELSGLTAKAADVVSTNLNKKIDAHIAKIEGLAQTVEDALSGATTPDALASALRTAGRSAVNEFQAYANTDAYKQDLKDIQSRIKTVKVIQTLGKVLVIMGIAALTGGAAAAWAGASLEAAGASAGTIAAGEFAAEVVGFTLASRLMNQAIDGKNDVSLGEDLLTNALMMGALKKAGEVYGKAFKMVADPKKYEIAYKAGGAVTGFVALQMFAEAHTLVKTGKPMDWDDRLRGMLSNALMMGAMELGGFLVKSAMKMPEMHSLAEKNAGAHLKALDGELAKLQPQLDKVKVGGQKGIDAAAALVPKLQELWVKQLETFGEAVKAEKDPTKQAAARETLKAATEKMNAELAKLDLKLASAGVDVQMAPGAGTGSHLFQPMKPGFVKFKPEGKKVIEAYYAENGGKLEPVPGKDGLFRGVDATGETFYAAEDKAQSFIDKDAGANKGKDVFVENTYVDDAGVSQPAKLNEKKIKDAVTRSKKAPPPGTKLEVVSVSGNAAELKMEVPSGGATAQVQVKVTVKPRGELAKSQAHGEDAGTARLDLERDATSGVWTAHVEVSETMRPEDVQFAIDHELTEAAELVKRNPGGKPVDGWGKQIEAGVMKDGATTDQATAHDVAAAREVVNLWKDLQNFKDRTTNNAKLRQETFDRAMEAQGLHDPSQVPAKIDLLRKAGAPEDMLADLKQREAKRVFDDLNTTLGGRPSTLSQQVIEHILFPEPKTPTAESGVKGGHHTVELTNFADAPNKFQLEEVGTPKPHGGTTYRHFKQWGWKGDAAAKPKRGSAEAPGGAKFDASKWTPIEDPKTTFDDPAAFIADAEAGYAAWVAGGGTPGAGGGKFTFTTPGGVAIIGYAPGGVLGSIFPDGAWIP